MTPRLILAVALVALAAPATLPLAGAASSDCYSNAPREELGTGVRVATRTYYAGSPADAGGLPGVVVHTRPVGLWQESNGVPGLQSEACVIDGHLYYEADTRVTPIGL